MEIRKYILRCTKRNEKRNDVENRDCLHVEKRKEVTND